MITSAAARRPFNRTIIELKQKASEPEGEGEITFNRTIIELKPLVRAWRLFFFGLLIGLS